MIKKDDNPIDDNIEFKSPTSHRSASNSASPQQKFKNKQQSSRGKTQSRQRGTNNKGRSNLQLKLNSMGKIEDADFGKDLPYSSRETFLMQKFKDLGKGEAVLENYCCAARMNLLLQGITYVTEKAVYFYSPFNNKTIFGHGTKIKIPYSSIRLIKKESTLLIFPNAIRFVLNTQEEIVLASFISRDTCYSLILRQFAIAGYSQAAIDSL